MTTTLVIGIVVLLIAVLLARAALYKPEAAEHGEATAAVEREVDAAAAAEHLAEMVRCKTVSTGYKKKQAAENEPPEGENEYSEFVKFRSLLEAIYPESHRVLERELISEHSLLYRWIGVSDDKPLVLMAHYDVVPADAGDWKYPPFDGVIEDEVIWGRGTLDTKATLCGIFEAVELLIKEGFTPQRDIYLSFGHDEETMGKGALSIVEYLREKGIRPEAVLDEGGAIVEGIFPGVKEPMAVVGMSEKGVADIEVLLHGSGGHSSTPGPVTPLSELSKIILRLNKNPFPAHLPGELMEMFAVLGRHMPFGFRIIFANLWLFKPLLKVVLPRLGRELNALCRTTCVFTMAEGSRASNVIPEKVRTVANLRLSAADPLENALEHVKTQAERAIEKSLKAKDPYRLEVNIVSGHNASPSSSTSSAAYMKLRETIEEVFRGTIVTPYIMLGVSDSRHYCAICDNVLRFSPIQMSREELRSIHGIDERIPVAKLGRVVVFYLNLICRS